MKSPVKKILFGAAALLLLFTAGACAQEKDRVTQGATAVTDLMKSQLGLTDAQYKKVYDVNLDFLTRAQGVRQSDDDAIVKVKAVKKLDKERDVKLKAILTAAQYQTFLVKKEENREKIKAYYQEKKAGN